MPRIIVLSDGEQWEVLDPAKVSVVDITDDAFHDLCEGTRRWGELNKADIIDESDLNEWRFEEDGRERREFILDSPS
jgi:hypothetical protein